MPQALAASPELPKAVDDLSPTAKPILIAPAKPLRILHIITDLCVAGAEMKLYKLLATANRERFAATVVSMRDRGELRPRLEALGIPVHSLGIRGSLPGPASVTRLWKIVRQTRPDVIHGWMYHGNLAAQIAALFAPERPAVLWSIHQSLYGYRYEKRLTAAVIKLGARLSGQPEKIVYVSRTSAAQHEAAGYSKDRTLVVHYGFDTEKFAPSATARRSVREELGLPEKALLIGMTGRYHPVKDHANFLRAANLVSQGHPQVRFLLCGKGVDGDNAPLRSLIEPAIRERIQLLGERHDIQRIMATLDIAVSSSCSEGFPNVVGEAMSAGVPCVVTAVSDLAEIVGATGRVVPPSDSAALAAGIEELIAAGEQGRQALGAAARARVKERYSLESSVAQYEAVYTDLTNKPVTGGPKNMLPAPASAGEPLSS